MPAIDVTANDVGNVGDVTSTLRPLDDDPELAELVAGLPEIYQPIYGYVTPSSSRTVDLSRTEHIDRTTDAIAAFVGRPLRVLDLGSSQGFYTLRLAERGHAAVGIDFHPGNVAVSDALARRHPGLDVSFRHGDVVESIDMVRDGHFDLVLGLSVLHHVAHRDGHDVTASFVASLAEHVEFGLFEMALRDEPLYWAASLPHDPRVTLAPYRFVRQITRSDTHLSELSRPLLFCSSSNVLIGGAIRPITSYSETSHAAAAAVFVGRRRYYRVGTDVVKLTAQFIDDVERTSFDQQLDEMRHEAAVLDELRMAGVAAPDVIEFSDLPDEVLVARTGLPGALLSEMDTIGLDRPAVFRSVLSELARFEEAGWFHADLRTWNVLWDADAGHAHLIDFGALRRVPSDVSWPFDMVHSLLIFAIALHTGTTDQLGLDAPRAVHQPLSVLPGPVAGAFGAIFAGPPGERPIAQMIELLDGAAPTTQPVDTVASRWLVAYGQRLRADNDELRERIASVAGESFERHQIIESERSSVATLEAQLADLRAQLTDELAAAELRIQGMHAEELEFRRHIADRDRGIEDLRAAVRVRDHRIAELEADVRAVRLSADHHQTRAANAEAALAGLQSSLSWRVTAPLRRLRSARG
jgi:SAM-dependent methyltransferase